MPGYTFTDPSVWQIIFITSKKTRFHRSQTLNYKSGYRIPDAYPKAGIGGYPLNEYQLTESELDEIANYHPSLTYTRLKPVPLQDFTPSFVELDGKVLRFYGYFTEKVPNSPNERSRIRHVVICYYLKDNTMHIYEPVQLNSGLAQGWLNYLLFKAMCFLQITMSDFYRMDSKTSKGSKKW